MRSVTNETRRPRACRSTVSTIAAATDSSCISRPGWAAWASSGLTRRGVRLVGEELGDRLHDQRDRPADGLGDVLGEPEPDLLDHLGLARDDDDLPRPPAHRLDEAQHGLGVHPVGIDHLAVLQRTLELGLLGLHHVEGSRLAALAADVDE